MKIEMDDNTLASVGCITICLMMVLGMASCVGCVRAWNPTPTHGAAPSNPGHNTESFDGG